MNGRSSRSREREHGQILVLFALSAIAIMAAVGLVLDGGGAFAQLRVEQSGADLASLAGANAYMNTSGSSATRTTAAIAAARAAATRNGYTHGTDGSAVAVTVTPLASGADVKVDITKPHKNSFSSIIPGQGQWNVSVTATAVAGVIDTAVGAAPWTMSIEAFNADGSPKFTSANPQDFSGCDDAPSGPLGMAWTDYNGDDNVNSNEVKRIIDGTSVITATFAFGQYLGQHNTGCHATLFGDTDAALVGKTVPVPIVGAGSPKCTQPPTTYSTGCFKGWAKFYVVSASQSGKYITGYFKSDFKSQPLTVGECTDEQLAAGQCGGIEDGPFDNKIVRLVN